MALSAELKSAVDQAFRAALENTGKVRPGAINFSLFELLDEVSDDQWTTVAGDLTTSKDVKITGQLNLTFTTDGSFSVGTGHLNSTVVGEPFVLTSARGDGGATPFAFVFAAEELTSGDLAWFVNDGSTVASIGYNGSASFSGLVRSTSGGFRFPDNTTQTTAWSNILTTKGDLVAAAEAGVRTRLPVGTNGQVLTADSTQSVGVKWASGAPSTLATKPVTPHASDEEFEDTLSGWTLGGNQVATAIDPYAAFTTGATDWRYSLNSRRPSYLMVQPAASGTAISVIHKSVTVGTNFFVYARLCFQRRAGVGIANNDIVFGLRLGRTSGGELDANNMLSLYLNESDAGSQGVQAESMQGGVYTLHYTVYSGNENLEYNWEYIAIHKVGDSFKFWVAGPSGGWSYIGATTIAGANYDRLALVVATNVTTAPGNLIVGCDFIRFGDTATFLP